MNRKGQALVEFVLILPLFILILFSVIDFGIILNKKNELENTSIDIISMINNGVGIDEIKNNYSNISINIEDDDKYMRLSVSEKVNIITPFVNLVLDNPYDVKVERVIPNVKD